MAAEGLNPLIRRARALTAVSDEMLDQRAAVGLGWVEPPSERSERWRRYWVSEETRGMTGWETGFD